MISRLPLASILLYSPRLLSSPQRTLRTSSILLLPRASAHLLLPRATARKSPAGNEAEEKLRNLARKSAEDLEEEDEAQRKTKERALSASQRENEEDEEDEDEEEEEEEEEEEDFHFEGTPDDPGDELSEKEWNYQREMKRFDQKELKRIHQDEKIMADWMRKRDMDKRLRQSGLKFVDTARITAIAGRGGDGCSSMRREKYIPFGGPDGGDGGNGGDVIIQVNERLSSLRHVKTSYQAQSGEHGQGKAKTGRRGDDMIISVPLGTVIRKRPESTEKARHWMKEDIAEWPVLIDLAGPSDRITITSGTKGGKGNLHFFSSTNKAPRERTFGEPPIPNYLHLEIKSLADVGLVGFPNAGKSSFLKAVSNAHPKIAPYPFTTLNPYIGTVEFRDFYQMTVADIPGLVKGAHKNMGLGHTFLRHVERSRALLYVVDILGGELEKTKPRLPWEDLEALQFELEQYKPGLTKLPSVVVANKMDGNEELAMQNLEILRGKTNLQIFPISAKLEQNIVAVTSYLRFLTERKKEDGKAMPSR